MSRLPPGSNEQVLPRKNWKRGSGMTTELARIESITPAELFKPGALDPILERIEAEVRREAACLDISTPENRKALASLAFKVAKSKTFVEARGKDLVAGRKEELKAIDRERGRVWDRFEKLQDEVRKPLTDWENAEKERVAKHESNLQELVNAGTYTAQNWESLPLDAMRDRMKEILADREHDWQEFHSRAVAAVTLALAQIREAIGRREKLEADRAELEKLRAEQAKRDQQEREERIAREADARAVLAAKLAEQVRQRVEDERNQAEARAKQAEAQRAQIEAQAAAQAEAAVQSAARAAQEATERQEQALAAERQRAEDARKAEAAAAEKREANKRHSAKIIREVMNAIIKATSDASIVELTKIQATAIVVAITEGRIPHTKISY